MADASTDASIQEGCTGDWLFEQVLGEQHP